MITFVFVKSIDKYSYTIDSDATVLDALKSLNKLSGISTTIFVTDSQKSVIGSVTDGDLRRAIIAGAKLTDNVDGVMHKCFIAFRNGNIDIDTIREARSRNLTTVPLLDCNNQLVDILDFSSFNSVIPVDAVLMAGGKGERLRPLTNDTPKPLLKIDGKCIIDYNIDLLHRFGINSINVTTNYLADSIAQHFADSEVQCIKEPKRLGTIGSLKLIHNWKHADILLMNSDLLTSINLEDFFLCHAQSDAMLTIASIPYTVSVPYAILQETEGYVTKIKEKPTYNYFSNAGIYLLKRGCLDYIPDNEYFDATDLIESLIANGKKVKRFTISGTWIDIGSHDDFRQAQELLKQHRLLNF